MRIIAGLDDSRPSSLARQLLTATPWPPGSLVRIVAAQAPARDRTARIAVAAPGPGSRLVHRPTAIDVELAARRGSGTAVLLDAARAFGADLIVVAGHTAGDPDDETHGLELDLVSRTSCPVLVARSASVTRILLAVDDSVGATALPGVLGRWRAFDDVPVEVVSVVPVDVSTVGFVTPWAPVMASETGRASRISHHQAIARRAARELTGRGWAATWSVRVGDPGIEIVGAAEDIGADLIVVASRGHHVDRPPHLGSVAGEVLMRAPGSVLLIGAGAIDARPRRVARRVEATAVTVV